MIKPITTREEFIELLKSSCFSEEDQRVVTSMAAVRDKALLESLFERLKAPLVLMTTFVHDIFEVDLLVEFDTTLVPDPDVVFDHSNPTVLDHERLLFAFQPETEYGWMEEWDTGDYPDEMYAPKLALCLDENGLYFQVVCIGTKTVKALMRVLKTNQQLALRLLDYRGGRIYPDHHLMTANHMLSNADIISTLKVPEDDAEVMFEINTQNQLCPISHYKFVIRNVYNVLPLVPIFLSVANIYSGQDDRFREYYQAYASFSQKAMQHEEEDDDEESEDGCGEPEGSSKWNRT